MTRTRRYLALFFIALLVFPQGRKVLHELDHLAAVHCDVHEKHFCAVEHDCALCDFMFSAATPPLQPPAHTALPNIRLSAPLSYAERFLPQPGHFHPQLRGPPSAC